MKKIIVAILCLFSILCIASIQASADIIEYENKKITDTTTIEHDFKYLNLEYSDYNLDSPFKLQVLHAYTDNQIEEQFIVAVAENREDENYITSYFYVYNLLFNLKDYVTDIQLKVSFNDSKPIEYRYGASGMTIEMVLEDKPAGLKKFKVKYFNASLLERKYNITINKGPDDPFECTYKTEINQGEKIACETFNFNSFLYITADEVVPVVLKKNQNVTSGFIGQSLSILMGMNPYDYVVVYFYNFSSNKQIDRIESATMKWEQHRETNIYRYPVEVPSFLLSNLFLFTDWTFHFGSLVQSTEVYDSESKKEIITQTEKEYTFLGKPLKMNAFCTPSSERLKELGNYGETLSVSDKQKFTRFDHSIMFTAGQWTDARPSSSGSGIMRTLMVEQVSLVHLNYTTNGIKYSAYVGDPDGPDTPQNPLKPIDPTISSDSWFVQMLIDMGRATVEFLGIDNVPRNVMIAIGGVEFGVICLVSIVVFVVVLKKLLKVLLVV